MQAQGLLRAQEPVLAQGLLRAQEPELALAREPAQAARPLAQELVPELGLAGELVLLSPQASRAAARQRAGEAASA